MLSTGALSRIAPASLNDSLCSSGISCGPTWSGAESAGSIQERLFRRSHLPAGRLAGRPRSAPDHHGGHDAMAHPVHSVQQSVSMTRSTKTTKRNVILFEIIPLSWEPPYGIEP